MKPDDTRFSDYWLAELLRVREAHWGPLEDAGEVRAARAQGRTFAERIVLRARLLCRREKLDAALARWRRAARLALPGLALLAALAGWGAALGALGNGTTPVNVVLALTAMLGLHCLTYLLWLASFGLRENDEGGARLGRVWLWATHKLAHGPDTALAPRALTGLLGRNGSLRWLLGAVSHGLWTVAFTILLLTLLAVLSARRYDFSWQTTLLTPDTFVHLAAILGWAPAHLGFATPPDAIVRISNGLHALPDTARALWSGWLIGCVVVYGLLPRLAGLGLCLAMARYRIGRLNLDTTLPGYADLRERLSPASEVADVAEDEPAVIATAGVPTGLATPPAGMAAIAGIELPTDMPWPLKELDSRIVDLGVINTRAQRLAALERLSRAPPPRLLLICDARQTPDRGAIALIAALAQSAGATMIVPLTARQRPRTTAEPTLADATTDTRDRPKRANQWRERLVAAGLPHSAITDDVARAMEWLLSADAPQAPGVAHA